VLGALALAGTGLVARAIHQQIIETDFLQREGQRRHVRVEEVNFQRGLILDRDGNALAVSAPVDSVWANPSALAKLPKEKQAHLAPLADMLGLSRRGLADLLQRNVDRSYVFLKRRLSPDESKRIDRYLKRVGLQAVGLYREHRRYYPTAEVFAQLVGFTDVDDRGQEGLELLYDSLLRGEPGSKRVIRDGQAKIMDVESIDPPKRGEDLRLSLDQRIQYVAYTALKDTITKHRARHGYAVLIDIHRGEVLAMANYPSFNPNGDKSDRDERYLNRAVTDQFEPGSTMKPFTIACAIDAGKIDMNTPIDTSPGKIEVNGKTIKDPADYGVIDPAKVIKKSSNVGASKIALSVPKARLWDCFTRFGFGSSTVIDFPGEVAGQLAEASRWSRIRHATQSFGYGLSVSALQLARAYATLAADGVRRPVSLTLVDHPPIGERAINSDSAWAVRAMMEGVVTQGGTGTRAAVPGYRIAGKTGTVKKIGAQGGYTDDTYMALFAGIAPASAPRLAMVVVVDEPKGKYYGGIVAAPVFSKVMGHALRLFNIPPDDLGPDGVRLAGAGDKP
jgi:cell division protein FtsI (penicillin-binding protein 3)